jgi:indole-3-glycerol phosphate synthase/phosphoribosylanthranilate isomerase
VDFLRRITKQVQSAVDEGHYRRFAETQTAPKDTPSLEAAIRADAPWAFLAEAKPSSPKAGRLNDDETALQELVHTYQAYNATGISVLTERDTFGGSLDLLRSAATSHPGHGKRTPVLMKDFILHEDQLDAARAAGASAVLLLYRVIQKGVTPWTGLDDAVEAAHQRGLEVLLEVDEAKAFEHAASTKAQIIGINNRDLSTLEMDPDRAIDILRHRMHLVSDRPVLSLSGIENRSDVLANQQGALTGVLVGTTLMQAEDPRRTLRTLRGLPHVKCCGAGHEDDSPEAHQALAWADAVGVVTLTPQAPRNREPHHATRLFAKLPRHVERVIVSAHDDIHELAAVVDETQATHLQWHREATPEEHQRLREVLPPGVKTIALVRLDEHDDEKADDENAERVIEDAKRLSHHADRILLDARPRKGDPPGGTGHKADAGLAARITKSLHPYPVVLAGGLDADAIEQAIRRVRPWGVDISSGTEDPARPGQKDPQRIWDVLRNARKVLNLHEPRDETEVDRLRVL